MKLLYYYGASVKKEFVGQVSGYIFLFGICLVLCYKLMLVS